MARSEEMRRRLAGASFASKQIFSRNRLMAWSHRSRYDLACRLLEPFAGQPMLDYGCGDGTLIGLTHDRFPEIVGAEVNDELLEQCRDSFGDLPNVRFLRVPELADDTFRGRFGVVVCLEVLEHLIDGVLDEVLADLRRLLVPEGRLIVSVPIEIGPTLPAKELARAWARRRNAGYGSHADERYRLGEVLRMTFAGERTAIRRPVYDEGVPDINPHPFHGHKGFNWKMLRIRLAEDFVIERTAFSPSALGPMARFLGSQVWFECRKR